ncbi:MAG: hypothetical protein ABJB66_05925 [Gemmatimonadaceae bacterium]
MTTVHRSFILLCLQLLTALSLHAQDASNDTSDAIRKGARIDQFLDGMYIGPRLSSKAEHLGYDRFEAQIAPHLYFFQSVESVLRPHPGVAAKGGWAVAFVPLLRLRMTNDSSSPVRTPTFNPQFVTVQKFFSWGYDTEKKDWPIESGWASIASVQYTIAHHSNGQDGCTFVGTGTKDGSCAPADFTTNANPKINTTNGNYGTNYETLGLFVKRFRLDKNHTERMAIRYGLTWERYEWTLVSEHLPGGLGNDTASVDFQKIFGKHRVTADFEFERKLDHFKLGRLRTRAAVTYVSAAPKLKAQVKASLDGSFQFRGGSGMGIYGKAFYGQDYYNIRLQDVGFMGIIGLSWDVRPLQVFKIPYSVITGGSHAPPPPALGDLK